MPDKEELLSFLGRPLLVDPKAQILEKKDCGSYILETLQLELNQLETVPAYFAYPKGKKAPLVLFNHSHGGDFSKGKEELLNSSSYLQQPSFLETLIQDGYAVGCIDMWGFGERQGKKESELIKEFLVKGHTLWGMRIFDNQQFLSYLLTRPEIDKQRIGTIGMSMGGLMSWWLTAIDERITCCVDIAGQVDLEALIAQRGLDHHGFYYYLPGLLTKFQTSDIQKMIAPRPRLSLVGENDRMCPASGVAHLQESLSHYYASLQAKDHWQSVSLTGGHQETKEMRERWRMFFKKWL